VTVGVSRGFCFELTPSAGRLLQSNAWSLPASSGMNSMPAASKTWFERFTFGHRSQPHRTSTTAPFGDTHASLMLPEQVERLRPTLVYRAPSSATLMAIPATRDQGHRRSHPG
jgi:hypothetical protein